MSCDGWEIDERCEVIEEMNVAVVKEYVRGRTKSRVEIIEAGTDGVVLGKMEKLHILQVRFAGIQGVANLTHEQMHNLKKK